MPEHPGNTTQFYRPRNPEVSPFYKIVRDHFNDFEQVYPQRYGLRFGFWWPVIREVMACERPIERICPLIRQKNPSQHTN